MLRIAICDDDVAQTEAMSAIVTSYFHDHPDSIHQTTTFSSAPELLWSVEEQGNYDLYLLDILLPDITGIELGLKLRQHDPHCLIIYLTSSPEYAVDSYQVRAFHYLLKPITAKTLHPVLDQAIAQLNQRESASILVKTRNTILRLPIDQVMYAELLNRAVRYYLTNGEIIDSLSIREPFHTVTAPLQQHRQFVPCGASFVVNLEHVSAINKDFAVLDNNLPLRLPKQAYNSLRAAWLNYWLEEDRT